MVRAGSEQMKDGRRAGRPSAPRCSIVLRARYKARAHPASSPRPPSAGGATNTCWIAGLGRQEQRADGERCARLQSETRARRLPVEQRAGDLREAAGPLAPALAPPPPPLSPPPPPPHRPLPHL